MQTVSKECKITNITLTPPKLTLCSEERMDAMIITIHYNMERKIEDTNNNNPFMERRIMLPE